MKYALFLGSFSISLTTYVLGNLFFLVVDLTGKPAAILKYKIQEEKHVPVSIEAPSCRGTL